MIWIVHFISINLMFLIYKKTNNRKMFISLTFLYSIIVFGQRWMTGEDFPGYLLYYLINFKSKEPGYFFLQNFFVSKNLYFGTFIFLLYLITKINSYRFFLKFKEISIISIYLYCFSELYFIQMSQIRQYIAISFFVNGLFFFKNKKFILTLVNYILGGLFHFSIILAIPFSFITVKPKRKQLLILLIYCLMLPIINVKPLFKFELLGLYTNYLGSVYDTQLSFFHLVKFYIFIFMFIFIIFNASNKYDIKENFILSGAIIYILLYGLSFQFAPLLRLANYFKYFELIFLVYFIPIITQKYRHIYKILVYSIYFGIFLGIAILDPYNISRYQFEPLKIYNQKSNWQYELEIKQFYLDKVK